MSKKPLEGRHKRGCGCHEGVPHVDPAVAPFDAPRRAQMPNDRCACDSGKKFKKCCGRG